MRSSWLVVLLAAVGASACARCASEEQAPYDQPSDVPSPGASHRKQEAEPVLPPLAPPGTPRVPPELVAWAKKHPWPGNVRELRAAVEQAIALARHPELQTRMFSTPVPSSLELDVSVPYKETKRRLLDELERRYITELLDAHGGNVSAAARAADLDRMTIYKMLRRALMRN